MFPRYGRKNRKYRVKAPKTKMSYVQKLKLQSAISAIVLTLGVGLSFFGFMPAKRINAYLYNTYTLKEWRAAFSPIGEAVAGTSVRVVSAYMGFFRGSEDDGKTDKKIPHTPTVKAQKEEAPIADAEEENAVSAVPQGAMEELWRIPASGEVSSEFGERIHPLTGEKTVHTGIDIAANSGDPVFAVHSGTVEKVGYDDANGHYVILSHGNGVTSVYIHLSGVMVSAGQSIPKDTKIGEAGSTGISTGPHLHFEIKENGVSVDPKKYIKQW